MNSFTDIEQSKKLAEILPIESADMRYSPLGDNMHPWIWTDTFIEKDAIPCWSLAALLDVLPQKYYSIKDHETNLILGKHKDKWCALYWDATGMQDGEQTLGDSPVDACVAMIEKLHEQNLL